jgi:hypothetical protein
MRDKTHIEQVERWAEFVRNNSRDKWKPVVDNFIDAQFEMAEKFHKNLEKTESGRIILERIKENRIKSNNG